MTHNFILSTERISTDPTKYYWACANCDSGVLIPIGYSQHDVNKFMESKMPCMPPILTPEDEVIDNRTTIVKGTSKIYTGKN